MTIHNEGAVRSVEPATAGEGDVQRDMDLVRSIMLAIEDTTAPIDLNDLRKTLGDPDEAKLVQHIRLLSDEAGYIQGVPAHSNSGYNWLAMDLTWNGHEFLESIRDPEIWRQTKAGAKSAGSFSIKVIADIAKAIIKDRVDKLIAGGSLGEA